MKTKIIFKNDMDKNPIAEELVEVQNQFDGEPIRLKLIELLSNDETWKCFGNNADIIEIEFQYEHE